MKNFVEKPKSIKESNYITPFHWLFGLGDLVLDCDVLLQHPGLAPLPLQEQLSMNEGERLEGGRRSQTKTLMRLFERTA